MRGRVGPAPDVGEVLRARADEISERIVAQWRKSRADHDSAREAVESDIRRATRAGTLAVADYLTSGHEVGRQRSEQWDSTGAAPVLHAVTLSDITKLYLSWRETCIAIIHEQASARRWAEAHVERAVHAVQLGSDASLVRMAKRFELTRHQLVAQLAENQARLEHQALHDPLTGLANRVLLLDRLDHALQTIPRRSTPLAVLFLDLDHFKSVNDGQGHSAGDQLLVDVSLRLQRLLRPSDTVARFGGDEFIVLCEDLDRPVDDALAVARRITTAFEEPFRVAGHEIFVAVSVGVTSAEHGDTAEEVLARADQAMYRAKQLGRSRIQVYDPALDQIATRHAELTAALRHALGQNQLHLAYQPVLDLTHRRLVAREALLRWSPPGFGNVPPDEFIPIAEQTGLITPIGRWVLHEACRDCVMWQAGPSPGVGVTVNVSGRQLEDTSFVDDVRRALETSGLSPRSLTLEVTETRLMVGRPEARAMLRDLRALGVRIAIDDFGTGYSSLSWLARLPLDVLKVDRSFVAAVGVTDRESAIVQAMIRLAHTLGLQVIGEGVETATQLDRLASLGCDQAQGYLLGYPEPLPDDSVPPAG